MTRPSPKRTPLDTIPRPELIRDRLSRLFAEARLLRGLLRLAEARSRGLAAGPDDAANQGVSRHGN